ncbi:ExbD/TolR family protein [Planctomicrobium sp. SH668]|uniref:ExbD/TolR family protein n=1 Tax=Planctomicrobium sp. SH668 TaxID=3448126 RepID=UPI003F5B2A4E
MPIKSNQLKDPELNLVPMVDVLMVLMIFFMVGTQFIRRESQYEIKLPTVTEAMPLTDLPDELVVNVQEDGTFFLGAAQKTTDELLTDLIAAQKRYPEQVVVIRGDESGRYQHVMTVLNLCKRASITNIQLANRISTDGGS